MLLRSSGSGSGSSRGGGFPCFPCFPGFPCPCSLLPFAFCLVYGAGAVIEHLVKGEIMQMKASSSSKYLLLGLASIQFFVFARFRFRFRHSLVHWSLVLVGLHCLLFCSCFRVSGFPGPVCFSCVLRFTSGSLSKLDYYLTKTYYKTASLIANSCKAVAILGGSLCRFACHSPLSLSSPE